MAEFEFDLFVIGAGSGGVRAARMSASYGAKVAVAEDTFFGGTCVNVGCVPKKLFVYGAHFSDLFHDAQGYGWQVGSPSFNWSTLRDNKTEEIKRLNRVYENLLKQSGVEIINGTAKISGPNTVVVGERTFTAKNILIATGNKPFIPDIPGKELAITSNEVFYLDQLPEKVLVVGGGYIAVEFAGILNGLGVDTTLVYRGPLFLRYFDEECRRFLLKEMEKKNINLKMSCDVVSIQETETGLEVTFDDGAKETYGEVLYATGREPRVEGLWQGVEIEQKADGAIKVDLQYRTSTPNIYAIGDVIGHMQLTPVALAEGMAIAWNLFKEPGKPKHVDYKLVPSAIFSQPSYAFVGWSEEEAMEKHPKLHVYTSQFTHLKHTISPNQEKTFMKLVVDAETDRVLGAHMVGDEAAEIIQGIAVAIKAGATKTDFDQTIGIHPSAAEEFVTMRQVTRTVES